MPKLLNLETEEVEDVPEGAVTSAVAKGSHSLPVGEVSVVAPDGTPGTIPAEKATEAFRKGFRLETAKETQLREAADSPGTAFAEGAGRGLTFGLSDLALTKSGLVSPEGMEARKEANPVASVAGELAGTGASLLIPGGGAVGLAGKAGGLAERAVARAAGEGLAGRLAAKAAGGALEGSLFGMGNAVTESVLHDTDLTAEKLLAGAGVGALIGGAGGAGLEGVTSGVRAAGGKLFGGGTAKLAAEAGTTEASVAEGALGASGAAPKPAGNFADILSEAKANPEAMAKTAKATLEGAATENAGTLKKVFEALDIEYPTPEGWVLRDLDLKSRELKKLGMKDLVEDAPKLLLEDARYAQAKTLPEKLELIRAKQEEAGQALSSAAKRIDGAASYENLVDGREVAERIRDELVAPLKKGSTLDEPIAKQLEAEAERISQQGKLTFADAEAMKRSFDAHLRWDSETKGVAQQKFRELRGILNGEIETKASVVAKELGDDTFSQWKAAKKAYGAMAELGNAAESRLAARQGNRFFSLTDNLAGVAGLAAGGLNPLGLVASAAGAVVNKWGRERLPQVLALAGNKLRQGGGLEAVLKSSPALETVANAFAKAVGLGLKDSPQAFGNYTGVLANAAARGVGDLLETHARLATTDPHYGEVMARAGFPMETPDESMAAMHRAGQLAGVQKALAEHDKKMDAVVDGFLKGEKAAAGRARLASESRKDFEARAAELAAMASNPGMLADRFSLSPALSVAAPGVAGALTAAAARAVGFLHDKAPKTPHPPNMPALQKPWAPTDSQLATWEKYVRAVERPASVLEDLQRGTATKEAVEALRAVYPKLAEDVQQRLVERMAQMDKRLPFKQRQALRLFMGPDFDGPSPGARAVLQQAHTQAMQKELAKSSIPAPPASVRGGMDSQTQSQRLEGRGGGV